MIKQGERGIGLHLRLIGSLSDLAKKARRLQIPFFQCFLLEQETGRPPKLTSEEIAAFLKIRRAYFSTTYLHGSYWINLAGVNYNSHRVLMREINWAKRLEFTHIILHPGSAKGARHRQEGIDAVARVLNRVFQIETDVNIVLENTAHGKMSIGGDINDFRSLLTKLDRPEKLSFCIDTAHAHSYGYNIIDDAKRETFIDLLEQAIGVKNIVLLHLNDTHEKLGSRLDRHQVVGQGLLGSRVLKNFITNERLKTIPVLMELPELSEEEQLRVLNEVRSWDESK